MIRFRTGLRKRMVATVGFAVLIGAALAVGQDRAIPIKVGLWETTSSTSNQMTIPPEMEARIAAMPPDQQSMVRSRMGGAPVTMTNKRCVAGGTTMDSLLNQGQDRPGEKCSFTNRKRTSSGASFDTTCAMQQGTLTGHSEFHMIDSDHMTGTTHITGTMKGRDGSSMNMNVTSTVTSKYLGSDCGDVKPFAPPAVQ
jgi:hypothetical protein